MPRQGLTKEIIVAKSVEIIDEAISTIREIANNISPHILKNFGLTAAVRSFIKQVNDSKQIKIELQADFSGRLAENIEITLYRITQELVNNVIKHSKASEVNIQLFKANNDVILIVEDNGKGFSGKSIDGIGLLNISSRVDTVKGEINFEPSPQSGTLVTVKIPLER